MGIVALLVHELHSKEGLDMAIIAISKPSFASISVSIDRTTMPFSPLDLAKLFTSIKCILHVKSQIVWYLFDARRFC